MKTKRGVSLVAVAVAAAVLAGSGSSASYWSITADPTWSPDGTHVAVAYTSESTYRIAVVAVPGRRAARTIYSARNVDGCCDPMLWAAVHRILFVENFTLTSLPTTGGKPTQLFQSTPWFVLSPNRETAAFDDGCECESGPDAIGLVGVSGGQRFEIPKPADATDTIDGFSPDGTELVFARSPFPPAGVPPTLMVEHVGGGAPVPLGRSGLVGAPFVSAGAVDVRWSPDGRWIAFVAGGKLQVVSTAGGQPRVVAQHFGAFSWSPRSTRLAYVDEAGKAPKYSSVERLATVDLQGHRTVLWTRPALRYESEDSLDPPQWSPDGSRLVFLARSGTGYSPLQVWIIGARGRGLRRIA